MTTGPGEALEQISKLMDDRLKAVRTKDANASTSNLAPDILSFDVVNPLQSIGIESVFICDGLMDGKHENQS